MNFVLILIIINVIIYILPYVVDFSKGLVSSELAFLQMFWQQSDKIFGGEYYRVITSQFLHGSVLHLFFNMYTLWQVKSLIFSMNTLLGLSRSTANLNPFIFLFVYLTSGAVGSIASALTSSTPSVGASGAILGLFGFFTAYSIVYRDEGLMSSILLNMIFLGVIGFLVPNINNTAHLFGFIGGFGLYFVLYYLLPVLLKS